MSANIPTTLVNSALPASTVIEPVVDPIVSTDSDPLLVNQATLVQQNVITSTGAPIISTDSDPLLVNQATLVQQNVITSTGAPIISTDSDPLLVNQAALVQQNVIDPSQFPDVSLGNPTNPTQGLTGKVVATQLSATTQDQGNASSNGDWRVMLQLAPSANYLYKAASPGILQPLVATQGVIFPYTPSITINYNAEYNSESLTHSNYKVNQYKSSYVDDITITAEFTAQDTFEAQYLLAVIHFFRSMTKMFYGQDSNPKNGTPPPLCFMYGYGGYQFDNLPLGIRSFTYTLPPEVDYIKTTGASAAGTAQASIGDSANSSVSRLSATGITPGGTAGKTVYPSTPASASVPTTWVPTKIQLTITCVPILSRNNVSNKFSLQDYANGKLLAGGNTAGFW